MKKKKKVAVEVMVEKEVWVGKYVSIRLLPIVVVGKFTFEVVNNSKSEGVVKLPNSSNSPNSPIGRTVFLTSPNFTQLLQLNSIQPNAVTSFLLVAWYVLLSYSNIYINHSSSMDRELSLDEFAPSAASPSSSGSISPLHQHNKRNQDAQALPLSTPKRGESQRQLQTPQTLRRKNQGLRPSFALGQVFGPKARKMPTQLARKTPRKALLGKRPRMGLKKSPASQPVKKVRKWRSGSTLVTINITIKPQLIRYSGRSPGDQTLPENDRTHYPSGPVRSTCTRDLCRKAAYRRQTIPAICNQCPSRSC